MMNALKRHVALFLVFTALLSQFQTAFAAKTEFDDVALNISNNYWTFGYNRNRENPFTLSMHQLIFGKNAAARAYYDAAVWRRWRGSCYGVSVLAILLYMSEHGVGNFPRLSRFSPTAKTLFDLKVNSEVNVTIGGEKQRVTLQYLIELLHISQKDLNIQKEYDNNKNNYQTLQKAMHTVHTQGLYPVLIGIGCDNGTGTGLRGHALVGYDYEEVEGKGNEPGKTLLKVYDCNSPEDKECVVTLTKDANGNYTGWSYTMNTGEEWGSKKGKNSYITFVTYTTLYNSWSQISSKDAILPPEDSVLFTVGYNPKQVNAQVEVEKNLDDSADNVDIIQTDVTGKDQNFSLQTYWRQPHLNIINGEVIPVDSSQSYSMIELGENYYIDSGDNYLPVKGVSFWLDVGAYKIINNGDANRENKKWMLAVVHKDQAINVETDAKEVYVYLNDKDPAVCVEITEPGKKYEITFYTSLKTDYETGDMPFRGTTPDDVSELSPYSVLRYNGQFYYNHEAGVVDGDAHKTLWDIIPEPETDAADKNEMSENFRSSVKWGLSRHIVEGYKVDHIDNGVKYVVFEPNNQCTHKHILLFIWRYGTGNRGGTFDMAAEWAKNKGIISGDELLPDEPCSRADVMYYLWQLQGAHTSEHRQETLDMFTDVEDDLDYEHQTAIAWAYEMGITKGMTQSTFGPHEPCTRAQVVTFLKRMNDNVIGG